MNTRQLLTITVPLLINTGIVQAESRPYNVELVFWDDTVFRGSFEYDTENQQITNLQGQLDDTLMGNIEAINHLLKVEYDGRGGITAYAYQQNTTEISTNPPKNNNVMVAINFNATDPSLGASDSNQLAYMDCSPGGLMGQTCMYHLSWHNPVYPMEGGHGVLSQTITPSDGQPSNSDCLMNWAEQTYPDLFAPADIIPKTLPPYYYRFYSHSNAYLGVSATDSHVYYLGADGNMFNVGALRNWLADTGCF